MKIFYYESVNGMELSRCTKNYMHKSTMKKEYRNICNAFQTIVNMHGSPFCTMKEEEFEGGRRLTVSTLGKIWNDYVRVTKEVTMFYKDVEDKPLPF